MPTAKLSVETPMAVPIATPKINPTGNDTFAPLSCGCFCSTMFGARIDAQRFKAEPEQPENQANKPMISSKLKTWSAMPASIRTMNSNGAVRLNEKHSFLLLYIKDCQ